MEKLLSKEYKEKIVAMHNKKKWGGAVAGGKVIEINKYMILSNAKSVLDYGCGYGAFKRGVEQAFPDYKYKIYEYDPGIIGKDIDPPVCDSLICIDVLEHIEPDKIDDVLQHMYDKINNWAYINICCVQSFNAFADGTNLHVLIRPPEWWIRKFDKKWDVLHLSSSPKNVLMLLKKNKL